MLDRKESFALGSFSLAGTLANSIKKAGQNVKSLGLWTSLWCSLFIYLFICSNNFPSCHFICQTRLLVFFFYERITLPAMSWGIIIIIVNNLLVPTTPRHFPSTKESTFGFLEVHF